jgi:hypothetical protein
MSSPNAAAFVAPRTETAPSATTSESTGAPRRPAVSRSGARLGRGLSRLRAAALHGLTADGRALVDRAIAVALTHVMRSNGASSSSATIWRSAVDTLVQVRPCR